MSDDAIPSEEVKEITRYPSGEIAAPAKYAGYDGQIIIRTRYATIQRWKHERSSDLLTSDYCRSRDVDPKNDELDVNEILLHYVDDDEKVLYQVTEPKAATDGGRPEHGIMHD